MAAKNQSHHLFRRFRRVSSLSQLDAAWLPFLFLRLEKKRKKKKSIYFLFFKGIIVYGSLFVIYSIPCSFLYQNYMGQVLFFFSCSFISRELSFYYFDFISIRTNFLKGTRNTIWLNILCHFPS